MKAHECYHCKQWVEDDEPHDCWTTTERALTADLADDLRDAYERLRETAIDFGEQRIYASHHSIMFSRKACHFFVRPKRKHLELVIFLGRAVRSPLIKTVIESSRRKRAHIIQITHRDQVEPPITDWMREAYGLQDQPAARSLRRAPGKRVPKRPSSAARGRATAPKRRARR